MGLGVSLLSLATSSGGLKKGHKAMTKLCAVSVDLDEIPFYHQIHGLPAPEGPSETAVYDIAIDRLDSFAKAHDLPLTLFAVGQNLSRASAAAQLRKMASLGHEVGNHSYGHRYDLTRLPREVMRSEVERGAEAIEKATGTMPSGFRAPGYTITDELVSVLDEAGVSYDSSVFPCPAYWSAKTLAIGLITLRGRDSHSVVDTPMVLRAPTRPYRVGRPYWRPGKGLVELPIQVTRGPRLPFIGTSVTLAGRRGARMLAKMCVGEPLVNLELHGIDVLDAEDGLEALRPHQPDVRVSHSKKLEALSAAIEVFQEAGYAFVRLDEAARHFG